MEKLYHLCREHGLRLTAGRYTILEILDRNNQHLTIKDIYAKALQMNSSVRLATVYRMVNLLHEWGALKKQVFCGKIHYELARADRHEHFVDKNSNVIVEFNAPKIESEIREALSAISYGLVDYRLEIVAERLGDGTSNRGGVNPGKASCEN